MCWSRTRFMIKCSTWSNPWFFGKKISSTESMHKVVCRISSCMFLWLYAFYWRVASRKWGALSLEKFRVLIRSCFDYFLFPFAICTFEMRDYDDITWNICFPRALICINFSYLLIWSMWCAKHAHNSFTFIPWASYVIISNNCALHESGNLWWRVKIVRRIKWLWPTRHCSTHATSKHLETSILSVRWWLFTSLSSINSQLHQKLIRILVIV